MLTHLPGVYPAQGDTALLIEALWRERPRPGTRLLDLGTGSGAVALSAAAAGAEVTAVDVSRLALAAAWLNARLHHLTLRLRCGDLTEPVARTRFDLIVSNPPYLPTPAAEAPRRGIARAWDAGHDGRLLLDRICRQAPALLAPGGVLLIVQSTLAHPQDTITALRRAGLHVRVAAQRRQPFGPVLTARTNWLEHHGAIRTGQREEILVVIRGARTS